MNEEEPQAETLITLVNQLIEPEAPPPVPLTPQTWGWAALGLILLALALWGLWRWYRYHAANAYRRAALAELAATDTTAALAAILRRAALAAYPRAEVASLTGNDWTAFLSRTGKGAFPEAAGEELRRAPYRDPQAAPSPALRHAALRWLKTHRAAPAGTRTAEARA
ncbi:DUF4381 domain-containing protein [Salipiger mangrovisoli]|uniref:DUF4381 domain-containing protein n=1 Tax=Salipiger mangrovisoli TaxID=2865933 RepID=A0ABR9WW14_9RHOB|nr:DUF4381 domain-containing protein [Salipiger mangrovisoli]MBE9635479.1 DUF4381 domain-containing protein [Salipiger mangrovisoli]